MLQLLLQVVAAAPALHACSFRFSLCLLVTVHSDAFWTLRPSSLQLSDVHSCGWPHPTYIFNLTVCQPDSVST
jgi:hypothetical protein